MPTYSSTSESSASEASSTTSFSPPPSPTKQRPRPRTLRLHSIGEDPAVLIGKTLTFVRRSASHPSLTLGFSDGTTYRLLVDGYDPVHRGIPKELEMDESVRVVFDPDGGQIKLDLPVIDCTFTQLTDKAFKLDSQGEDHDGFGVLGKMQRWDQSHLGLAFKFADRDRWHCVWATLLEREGTVDGELSPGKCTFRSYDDVYLERVVKPPSPRTRRRTRGSVDISRA